MTYLILCRCHWRPPMTFPDHVGTCAQRPCSASPCASTRGPGTTSMSFTRGPGTTSMSFTGGTGTTSMSFTHVSMSETSSRQHLPPLAATCHHWQCHRLRTSSGCVEQAQAATCHRLCSLSGCVAVEQARAATLLQRCCRSSPPCSHVCRLQCNLHTVTVSVAL